MMIVKERPMYAVAAAIAWILMLHLWQAEPDEPGDAKVAASQTSYVATASALPRGVAGTQAGLR
jgi:hypothetical protein